LEVNLTPLARWRRRLSSASCGQSPTAVIE
jgi:hypothetical protein